MILSTPPPYVGVVAFSVTRRAILDLLVSDTPVISQCADRKDRWECCVSVAKYGECCMGYVCIVYVCIVYVCLYIGMYSMYSVRYVKYSI